MKKLINLFIFTINNYIFKYSNQQFVDSFEKRLDMSNKSKHEQILFDYYTMKNGHSSTCYYEKEGSKIYKDFFYYIIGLDDQSFLNFSDSAKQYSLTTNKKNNRFALFTKLEVFWLLLFILFIIFANFMNSVYIFH